jgi:hypothetical protein
MSAVLTIGLSTALLWADPVPRLSGGFVPLDDGAMELTPRDWNAFLTGPEDYGRNLKTILDGSEVTVVMLQDGVGARGRS